MRCPVCVEQGQTSTVFVPTGGVVTLMLGQRYYDEQGRYHDHDPNSHTYSYSCSNEHRWVETIYDLCLNCDFNAGRNSTRTG